MEVILFESVKNLGRAGDKVKVANGYYRNYLGPQGMAEEATPSALKRFEKMKKKKMELEAQRADEAREIAKRLEGVTITVKAKAGDSEKLFGSVTPQDIVDALAAQGFQTDKKNITTNEPVKHLGEYTVTIAIHPEVDGEVKLVVERS